MDGLQKCQGRGGHDKNTMHELLRELIKILKKIHIYVNILKPIVTYT